VRIEIRRVGAIKNGEQVTGNRVRAKVVKNKVAPPFKSAEFDIMFGQGISREGDLLDSGLALGAVERSGAWLSCGELRLGQGRENAKQFLSENRDVASELEKTIIEKARAQKGLPIAPKEESPEAEEA
jgi:recombination protein RecA